MKKRLLLFIVPLLYFGFVNAQTVQTTHGSSNQSYIPIAMNYEYSYTQHIVLKSELENAGWENTFDSIIKLRWYQNNSGFFFGSNHWRIYLGNTSKTVFSSTTDWVALEDLTEVYFGGVNVFDGGWVEVELSQPFKYDGVGNLVIAVNEVTSGSSSTASYRSTDVGNNRGLYRNQNDSIPLPDNPPAGTLTSIVPNLQLHFRENCFYPTNIRLTSVTSTTATIAWDLGLDETSWNLKYCEVGDTTWIPVVGLDEMTYEIDSLNPNTYYQVRLQSDCGTDGLSIFSTPFVFYTASIPLQLPYFNDFEDSLTHSDFHFFNGTQTNQWVISNAPDVNNTANGEYAMYISNDSITQAWAYTPGNYPVIPSIVYAFCDIEVPDSVTELKLTFDWIANGNLGYEEFMRVYWMPVNIEVVPGQIHPIVDDVIYEGQAQIGNYSGGGGQHALCHKTTWQQAEFVINTIQFPNLGGNVWRLYFQWRNTSSASVAAPPPATVDNIAIQVVECTTPSQLIASNPTATTVDLEWTENGDAMSWKVEYKKNNEDSWTQETVHTNPYTVENLDPITPYQFRVQSDCGTEISPYSFPVSFTTLCDTIVDLPWEEDFSSITVTNYFPPCWAATRIGNYVFTQVVVGSTDRPARTGTKAIGFKRGCNDYIFTPQFELQGGVSYDFSFWYLTDGFSGWQYLRSGVYSDQVSDSLIQQLAEVTNITNQTYQNLKGTFIPPNDGVYYFGVHCKATTAPWCLTIDDFKLLETPTCAEPTNLTVTNITPTTAEISFVPAQAGDTVFKVTWKADGESIWEEALLNGDTSFVLTNLIPNASYQVRVYTDCMDGTYSDFIEEFFDTPCAGIIDFPYVENFDTYGTYTSPYCWSFHATIFNPIVYSDLCSISAPYSLQGSSSDNESTILIAPKVDDSINLSDLQASFYFSAIGSDTLYTQYVQLGVIEDLSLPATFIPLQSFALTDSLCQYTGYFFNYDGIGKHVALKFESEILALFFFDDFVIDSLPDCPPVSDLTVTYVGTTSAMISWTPHGTPESFNVEVIAVGDDSGVQYNTIGSHYLLTGLAQLTDYIVLVTPNCSGDEGPSMSTTFTTVCASGGEVIVGTPEATTTTEGAYLPTTQYYKYSYSQQIFDATELSGINDTIYGIGFQYVTNTSLRRNVEIYLGHTDQVSYSSVSDYVPGTCFTRVFNGEVNFINSGENYWFMFDFTTPFVYDSDSNLVITVLDKSGTWSNPVNNFRTHGTDENRAIYYLQDAAPYNLSPTAGSKSIEAYRNNVKFLTFCDGFSCYPPDLMVVQVESHSIDFQIIPFASETSWEIEYKPSEETEWISFGIVNTTINNIPNLFSGTQYDLRVRSICGSSDISIWKMLNFTTELVTPATIPYSCNFEVLAENLRWGFRNSGQANRWYIGNASSNPDVNNTPGGTNALYISNDGGNTLAYTAGIGNNSKSYAYRDFTIPEGVTELRLTIDWIANGNGEADMLSLYWVSPDADIHAGSIPSGDLNVDSALSATYGAHINDIKLQGMTDWQESTTFLINNTQFPGFAGKTWRLYFMWRNDVASATAQQPPAVVDNIILEAVTCLAPSQLVATTATQTSVTLNWTETGNATSWNVEYRKSTEPTWNVVQTSSKPFVVNGLDHSSTYVFRVQANCGDELSGYSGAVTKNTLCSPVTDLPWEDSFESIIIAGEFPPCWSISGSFAPISTQIANEGSHNRNARTGTRCAYFGGNANHKLYTPAIYLQGGVSYDFSFWYVTDGNEGWNILQSAVYSNPQSGNPIQVLETVNNPTNRTYNVMRAAFIPETDGIYYFGVYCQSGDAFYLTVDDFSVSETPDCASPLDLEVSNITYQSIDLEWTERGDATEWEIEYGLPGFISGTTVQTSANSYSLTDLNHSTAYEVRVRAVCDVNEYSMWSPRVHFVTSCSAFELPFIEDFSTLPPCWTQTHSGGLVSDAWKYVVTGTQAGGIAGEMHASYYTGNTQQVGITRLISPLIRFGNAEVVELSFKHYFKYYTSGVSIKLQCSPDLENWSDLPFSHTGSTIPATIERFQFIPPADSLYIAWVIDGNHYYFSNWYIDDVSIVEVSTCLPFIDFETPSGFSFVNNASGPNWYVGSAPGVNHTPGGSKGLYISSDGGVSNVYTSTPAVVWAYKDFYFTPSSSDYTLTFDWKGYGESTKDYLNVYIGPPALPVANTTGTITPPAGTIALETIINKQKVWQEKTYTLSATDYSGQIKRLYFCWRNDNSGVVLPPIAIDNVKLTNDSVSCCPRPTDLAIDNISSTGATVTWSGAATSWIIEYKPVLAFSWTTQTVTGPTYVITGLQPTTEYMIRVKSLCADGEESIYSPIVTFTTGAILTYTIIATAGPGGTITPFGNITVTEGESQTFTFTPDDGYQIEALLVDDEPQVPIPESYTFVNIQANHTIHVDFVVGIVENNLSQYVTLYPNPTQYLIDLKIDRGYLGATECHIYDMYGRLMRVLSIEEEITTIDVSDFASGVYLVRLTTEQGQISKRFVKQ